MTEIKFQIGKSGINEGVLKSLALAFKNNKRVRVSILKSSRKNKEAIKEMALNLSSTLSKGSKWIFNYRIIGFTIIMHKHTK